MNLILIPIIVLFSIPIILVYAELDSDTNFLVYKGTQYFKLGQYEKAITFYDQALRIDSNHIEALYNKGNTLSTLLRYEEAISTFEKLLKIEPNKQTALIKLHGALLAITDYKIGFINGILEIKVHDSKGGLVAYQKVTNILALEHEITEKFIETWPMKKTVTTNNQNLDVYQQEFEEVMKGNTILGFHQIPYSENVNLPLTSTWFYQIPVEKGDVVSYVYSIFRSDV